MYKKYRNKGGLFIKYPVYPARITKPNARGYGNKLPFFNV